MHASVATPAGPFTVVVADDGAVLASGWTADVTALLPLIAAPLRPAASAPTAMPAALADALAAYLDGQVAAIDAVEVRQRSGPFVHEAWDALRRVPPGRPCTYTALAGAAGRPDAVRAAGYACARNAAALFVPCHRAVRVDGGLGGFRWGLPVKRWLLAHEAAAGGRGVTVT